MKRLVFLTVLSLAISLSCARTTKVPQPPSQFASRIKSILPATWELVENGNEVIIRRKSPITRYDCLCLDLGWMHQPELLDKFVQESGVSADYKIRLHRATKLDTAEYARLLAINDQIRVSRGTVIPPREFYERDAMSSFDPKYRELPEYFDDTSSIYVETTLYPHDCIHPVSTAKEVEDVWKGLNSMFHPYSNNGYSRSFSFLPTEPLKREEVKILQ